MRRKDERKSGAFPSRLVAGCVLVFVFQVPGQSWIRQNPLPVGPSVSVFDVCVMTTQSACVVGQAGAMSMTGNGGLSWSGLYPGRSVDLRATSFVDSLLGWVVGDTGFIARTRDGGRTWEIQSSGTGRLLEDVQFVDSSIGYAVGDTGTILKTTNGGASWGALSAPTTGDYLSVCFLNADTGWVSGRGAIARTNDGGDTWTLQGPTNSRYNCIRFVDRDTGWAGESFGAVYKTTNGGANWAVVYNFPSADLFWLYGLHFADARTGWAAGAFQMSGTNNDGRIMVTRDGGVTWSRQIQTAQTLLGVAFHDTSTGWAVGINGVVLKTVDGGASWEDAVRGPTNDLNDVCFTSGNTGWAVGGSSWDSTLILHTTNGGMTWTPQEAPVKNVGLESVFFLDSLRGWAAGQNMTILKTVDGGITWTGQSGGTTDLQCIFFTDTSNGWAVGGSSLESGAARRTQDGGGTWQAVTVPVTAPLNDVYFLNTDTGWIAGARGTVLRTYNAGTSFGDLSDSALGTVNSVHFLTTDSGWVAGSNGVFSTSDAGATWHRRLAAGTNLGACFVDPLTIYMITGSNTSPFPGYIYRTIDAGLTWQMQFIQNGVLWSGGLHFEDASTGWVVSGGGTILHTVDGGGSNWTGITGVQPEPSRDIRRESPGAMRTMPTAEGMLFLMENVRPAELRLQVYDPLGRMVWSNSSRPGRNGTLRLHWSCRGIARGLYFVRALQEDRGWNGRFLY